MEHATRFRDRADAGRRLAERLRAYAGRDDVLVLGLAPGGVPVAGEVARSLGAPLDVLVLAAPELGLGALAAGGLSADRKQPGAALDIPLRELDALTSEQVRDLEHTARAWRGDRPPPELHDRTLILVDEGLDRLPYLHAAIELVRSEAPARVIVAVPVASQNGCAELRAPADETICLVTPERPEALSAAYDEFPEVSDEEIRGLLQRARRPTGGRIGHALRPFDLDAIVGRASTAQYVLLGEASHGTQEFYRERAEITKRLIAQHGFAAVAVEADWPDAYRVNRFVRGWSDDEDADSALSDFRRFPSWMWRNREVADFVDWLRRHNEGAERNAGFYGLDLYSMHRSMEAVIAYLEDVDPEAAKRARERYSCFDHFGPDPQVYAYEASLGGAEPCERQALEQLLELHALGDRLVHIKEDEQFFAEQNARLVVDAEEYFRAMFRGGRVAWNLRARHMVETLEALVDHLQQSPEPPKLVVWAHNSHLGDARATEMGRHGELNVGQFLRERHGERAFLAGFSTYTGTVTAASDWGGPAERKHVRPALAGSWEDRFHRAGEARMLVDAGALSGHRLERAIGVIYRPETERVSHYFHAWLAAQFDAIMHIDETTAIEPLERTSGWDAGDLPETYPYGV